MEKVGQVYRLILQRKIIMPKMSHSRIWLKQLEKEHGAQQARVLLARAQSFYDEYCAMHTSEPNRANRSILRTRLLPGLSLYRVLHSTDRLPKSSRLRKSEALGEMDGLFRAAFFTGMVPDIRLLNRLPDQSHPGWLLVKAGLLGDGSTKEMSEWA
jgi:hypothetical protein